MSIQRMLMFLHKPALLDKSAITGCVGHISEANGKSSRDR